MLLSSISGVKAKIDQNVAHLITALRFGMHGKTKFTAEGRVRRRIGRLVATLALDSKPNALLRGNEHYDLVIRDHANGDAIDLRNLGAERLGLRGARASDQRADQRRHEARTAGAKHNTTRNRRRRITIARVE